MSPLKTRLKARQRGFTLIEILTVIFILAVLVTMIAPNMWAAYYRAKLTGCQSNLKNLAIALATYQNENSVYPSSLNSLISTGQIVELPKCPESGLSSVYVNGYSVDSTNSEYTICCKGVGGNPNHSNCRPALGVDEPWYNLKNGLGP